MDFDVVKAVADKGETNTVACIEPDLLEPKLTVQMQQMVNTLAGSLTKSQWKIEQESALEIGLVVLLIKKNDHLQYKVNKKASWLHAELFFVLVSMWLPQQHLLSIWTPHGIHVETTWCPVETT